MKSNYFNFSIIICTYNPEVKILLRCLNAIKNLKANDFTFEVILVDNNSTKPIKEITELKEVCQSIINFKIIEEPKPGLSNARIEGVNNSNANWIVFFDDDNEPFDDYLIKLKQIADEFSLVGIWGPGNVFVDFIDKPEPWVEKNCRTDFQEKHFENTEFALQKNWNNCYPPGTGMAVKKTVFLNYLEIYNSKKLKTTGRIGNSLLSAEDTQLIFSALISKYPVGTTPLLNINHIISGKKSTFNYIKKLRFSIRYSIPLAEIEFFSEKINFYKSNQLSQLSLFIILNKYLIKGVFKFKIKEAIVNCVLVTGNYTGINYALKRQNPFWLLVFLKLIGIQIK